MEVGSQRPKEQGDAIISVLNTAIETLDLMENASATAPARAVFNSASTILSTIRVSSLLVFC